MSQDSQKSMDNVMQAYATSDKARFDIFQYRAARAENEALDRKTKIRIIVGITLGVFICAFIIGVHAFNNMPLPDIQ